MLCLFHIRRTDPHDEFAFHRTTRVCGIREVGDVTEVGNRVEGGSWDAGPEIRLLFRIQSPREAELGNDCWLECVSASADGNRRRSDFAD